MTQAQVDAIYPIIKELDHQLNDVLPEKIKKKYIPILKFELHNAVEMAVMEWYESYSPRSYGRQESFFDAYHVVVTSNGHWEIRESSDIGGGHNQPAKIIYKNVFEGGSHGGSTGKPDVNGNSPDGPSWRYPGPEFTYWWPEKAPVSTPIPILMSDRVDEVIADLEARASAELIKEQDYMISKAIGIIISILS